jgi:aerobic-type carbon monoxide dehydrogenase small subunit (CoxS/CutS family)
VRLLHAGPGRVGSSPRRGDEIRHAMSGNICRCGTYPKIEEAILSWQG